MLQSKVLLILIFQIISISLAAQTTWLDSSFGAGGIVISNNDTVSTARNVLVQPDGKIIASGVSYMNVGARELQIVRYLTDGNLDYQFGDSGVASVNQGTLNSSIGTLNLLPDGKIVVTSGLITYYYDSVAIYRFDTLGAIDSTFGINGVAYISCPGYTINISCVKIQPDNKIVAAGSAKINGTNDCFITRIDSAGTLDSSFGSNGYAITPIGNNNSYIAQLALQSNNKIVAAGTYIYNPANQQTEICAIRYEINGLRDSTFGINGIYTPSVSFIGKSCKDVKLTLNGNILIAGLRSNRVIILKLNQIGEIDSSFGLFGIAYSSIYNSILNAVTLQLALNNNIIVTGQYYTNLIRGYGIERFDSTGTIDNSYGTNGLLIIAIPGYINNVIATALQNDQKLLLAGNVSSSVTNSFFTVARINSSIITTIEKTTNYSIFELVPNPASDHFIIKFKNPNSIEKKIKIFNSIGELVYSIESTDNVIDCYLRGVFQGVYIVRIQMGEMIYSEKILILP